MNPIFLPSLQHMASVKIVAPLYCDSDIQQIVYNIDNIPKGRIQNQHLIKYRKWKRIAKIGVKKLSVKLPNTLKVKLVNFIRPIHAEIIYWLRDHPFIERYTNEYRLFNMFCWNSEGIINRIETAKNLIQNPNLDVLQRFLMACTYFLEEDIVALWDEVKDTPILPYNKNLVVRFWINWLKKADGAHWTQMFVDHFTYPLIHRSDMPLRVTNIFDFLPQEDYYDYLHVIASRASHHHEQKLYLYRLNEGQQTELLNIDTGCMLIAFLKWPFQSLFMKMANQIWSYFTVTEFESFLAYFLTFYVLEDLKYFNYLEAFKEFWHSSPTPLKEGTKSCDVFQLVQDVLIYAKHDCFISFKDKQKLKRKYKHLV